MLAHIIVRESFLFSEIIELDIWKLLVQRRIGNKEARPYIGAMPSQFFFDY